ncbi:GNAT family N-acetyltransferase [Bacillus sp. AK031]
MKNLHTKKAPIITTDHYYLSYMETEYAPQMYKFLGDKETMKYLTPHPPQNISDVAEKIARHQEQYRAEKEIPWAIVDKATEEVIGMLRLHKLNYWHKKAEMGVVIRKDHQHKGVMKEILPRVLSYCFLDLGLNRVVGDIFAENIGSRKLLLSHGFKEEGILRQTDFDGERYHDTVVFSLLKNEYLESVQ